MQGNEISLSTSGITPAETGRLRATAIARRVLQGVGGGACVMLGAAMPWAGFSAAGMTIGSRVLPMPLLVMIGLTVGVGLGFFAASVWGLVKRLPVTIRVGVFAVAGATVFSVAGIEYGMLRHGELVAYEYRPAVRMVAYALGIALLACSIPEELGPRFGVVIRSWDLRPRHLIALSLFVVAASSFIGAVVLDGMPHIIDGTSYILQSRMIWSGQFASETPMYPELFASELVHFRIGDAGYYSKYPTGWPMLLGLFDSAGVAWLANAFLAGLLVVLTYAIIAERGDKRLAGLAAVIVAICPWLWLNAGTMMPHLASAVWLWLFLWLFVRGLRLRSRLYFVAAGLALGIAVLTRPADAAFFALPCIIASLCWVSRRPRFWLSRLPLVAAGALPGVIAYLAINGHLAGSGATSTYGSGHTQMLFMQVPDSVPHALAWLHESWVGLNRQWFAGALPAAMMIVCGVIFGGRFMRGQWLVMACALSLFLCYGVFVFGGRAWVGPRWYVPLIPAAALLIAAGLRAAAQAGRIRSAGGVLAAGYLRAALAAAVVILFVAVPVHLIDLHQHPPHGVDGRVTAAVEQAGIEHAVVALPPVGFDPETGKHNYKRGIAGMWAMQVPFEDSPIIYVSAIDGWEQKAAEAWPDRELFTMNPYAGSYVIYRVAKPGLASAHGATK